nr:SapC family protein [Pseudoxanthomonas sp. SGNA-20]
MASLHRSGWLEGAYLMLASLHNVGRLVARKRARLAAQA